MTAPAVKTTAVMLHCTACGASEQTEVPLVRLLVGGSLREAAAFAPVLPWVMAHREPYSVEDAW